MNRIELYKKKNERTESICLIFYFISLYTIGTLSSITMTWIGTIITLSVSVLFALMRFNTKMTIDGSNGAWIIVVGVCFFCSVHSGYFQDFAFYFLTGILVITCSNFNSKKLYSCLVIMLIGAIVFGFGVYLQYFQPSLYDNSIYPLFPEYYQSDIIRQYYRHQMYTGFNTETSISAEFMILGVCSLYCFYSNLKNKYRKYTWILGAILFYGIILTGKRSSLLFSLTAFLYTNVKCTHYKKRVQTIIRIVMIGLVVLIVGYYLLPHFIAVSSSRNTIVRIAEYVKNGEMDVSNNRFAIWEKAFDGFTENPFIGKGWGWYKEQNGSGSHNIYLQLLCECGIIGAMIVVSVLLYYYRMCHKIVKKAIYSDSNIDMSLAKFSLFSQTFFLLYGITGNPLYNYSFFLWYIFSLIITLNLNAKKTVYIQ